MIYESESPERLMEQLMEYPLAAYVAYDIKPLVEIGAAFDRFIAFLERENA